MPEHNHDSLGNAREQPGTITSGNVWGENTKKNVWVCLIRAAVLGAQWLRAPLHTESLGHPNTTPTSAAHCCLYIECVFIGSNYSALHGQ